MRDSNHVVLVDRLRSLPAETEWLEFKRSRCSPAQLGEYLSALANSACLAYQRLGYLIFGIDDGTHRAVGTDFDPYRTKAKGNQDLLPWLAAGLRPNVGFDQHLVEHPDGRVVLFQVAAATDGPVEFFGKRFIRIGSSKTELRQHRAKERTLWLRGIDWTEEICERATLADLDPDAITKARQMFSEKHPNRVNEIQTWSDVTLLNKAKVLKHGSVTNTALILLGRPDESYTLLGPRWVQIRWSSRDDSAHPSKYEDIGPPFLLASDRLLDRIRNPRVRASAQDTGLLEAIHKYDAGVIREALHNAIAHQDYDLHGRIVVVERPDHIEIGNVGTFIPRDVEMVIRENAPQYQSRNKFLSNAMVNLNLSDSEGGGIKHMFEIQRKRSFPLPEYDLSRQDVVKVTLSGRMVDEQHSRLLIDREDLTLDQAFLIDQLQKGKDIGPNGYQRLENAGFPIGKYPNIPRIPMAAQAVPDKWISFNYGDFTMEYYLDMVTDFVANKGPVSLDEVDKYIREMLPSMWGEEYKKSIISELVQQLRKLHRIEDHGIEDPRCRSAVLEDSV